MTAASPSFAGTWRREREGEQEGRRKNDDDDDDDEVMMMKKDGGIPHVRVSVLSKRCLYTRACK